MARRIADPDPKTDPADPDELEPDEDENGEKSGEDEPEALRGAASAPVVAAVADPAPAAPAAAVPPVYASEQVRASRVGTWLPLSDDRVGSVLVYKGGGGPYLYRLKRPFPDGPIERWVLNACGPGSYRLIERGIPPNREYVGSLTIQVGQEHAAPYVNGAVKVGQSVSAVNGATQTPAPAPVQFPPGTDYRLALVTVGLPILAEVAKAFVSRPQGTGLSELVTVAKLLQGPPAEQGATFREAIKLVRELAAEAPVAAAGEGLNLRDIFSGIGEVLRVWRESRPAASSSPASAPPGAPVAAGPPAAGELQALQGETSEQFVERVIVTEIQRATGSGDTPDCLVTILAAWLPSSVVQWLETTPEDEVLAELPNRFPAHTAYLQQVGVQQFLRSALQMLREDAQVELEEVPPVRAPAPAVAAG